MSREIWEGADEEAVFCATDVRIVRPVYFDVLLPVSRGRHEGCHTTDLVLRALAKTTQKQAHHDRLGNR